MGAQDQGVDWEVGPVDVYPAFCGLLRGRVRLGLQRKELGKLTILNCQPGSPGITPFLG